MLVKCPECELQVSDKALTCPHCGYPLKAQTQNITRRRAKKMKLPNGFGQISEIKNRNLRKPFRAMVTVGKDENGRPICKPLKPDAYFKTYNEAYEALVKYNKNPFEMNTEMMIEELYEKWFANRTESNVADTTLRQYSSAWRIIQSTIPKLKVVDLKISHIKLCLDAAETNNLKRMVKILFNLLLDYAVEYDIVPKNLSRQYVSHNLNASPEPKKEHIPYTDAEISLLWKNVNKIYGVDLLLIQCYTGLRPQEIGLIELENYFPDTQFIKGGMKTDSGKDRMIPIHSKIQPLVKAKYNEALQLGSKYLFNFTRDHKGGIPSNFFLSYVRFKSILQNIIKQLKLNPDHKGHDGRKHFVTMAKRYGMDEYAIKRIVGHKIEDLTERVYTERDLDWLRTEIEKIKS